MWTITTFFVVPVIAYENLGAIAAFKRSASLMKEKWGESLGASFSLGLIQFLVILLTAIPVILIMVYINVIAGALLGATAAIIIFAWFSAAKTLFVSSVYHNITGNLNDHFDQQIIDSLFVAKK